MSRERRITHLFTNLTEMLVRDHDVADLLHTLAEGAADVLEVDAVGVLLGRGRELALTAASSEEMSSLEVLEAQRETGPCYDAFIHCQQVVVPDLREVRDRWPTFVSRALELGFQSGHAFPLRRKDESIGALNAFRRTPGRLDDADLHLAQSLANVAAIGITQKRALNDADVRASQLEYALSGRVLIEQAKGVLAERRNVPPTEAFEQIRAHARSHNLRLRDLCDDIVTEGFDPPEA